MKPTLFPHLTTNDTNNRKHDFHEPIFVEKLDTRMNFIIECQDENELNELKRMLNSKSKKVRFEIFKRTIEKLDKWQKV